VLLRVLRGKKKCIKDAWIPNQVGNDRDNVGNDRNNVANDRDNVGNDRNVLPSRTSTTLE